MKKTLQALLFLLLLAPFIAQSQKLNRPKIVVGIVVDQMRWDFLYRYYDRYGTTGFKRLVTQGFTAENCFIPYTPTYTAAGHASIYTGSVPAINGIIGNNWYIRQTGKGMYCTDDSTVSAIGSDSEEGKMSPRNMWTNTITDELRLATNFQNKTIGISLKDRGAILPAGHSANAAYWFDNKSGGFISSTYYMDKYPEWVNQFNDKKLPDSYLQKDWQTLYPINTYTLSSSDNKAYEGGIKDEGKVFPHITSKLNGENRFESFKQTPYGNNIIIDMAKAAIEGEKLGARGITDFLAVSFSSPDYIGHSFGPNSIEIEDTYLRLDKDLGAFLSYLDGKFGANQYLVFLSADHGVAHVPGFANENKLPGGTYSLKSTIEDLNKKMLEKYGSDKIIEKSMNYQIYLNRTIIEQKKLDKNEVEQWLIHELVKLPYVTEVISTSQVSTAAYPARVKMMVNNGYNTQLSGDLQIFVRPQYFEGGKTGTTHGSWNPYDAHIPCVFFGWNIKPGKTHREVYMTDIAPTLAGLLKIQMPNGCVGTVITEAIK